MLLINLQVKLKINFEFQNFELALENLSGNNPYLFVDIGDFNAKRRQWYSQDTDTFDGILV